MPTWDSVQADRFWEAVCGKERWHGVLALEEIEKGLRGVPDDELWKLRLPLRGWPPSGLPPWRLEPLCLGAPWRGPRGAPLERSPGLP